MVCLWINVSNITYYHTNEASAQLLLIHQNQKICYNNMIWCTNGEKSKIGLLLSNLAVSVAVYKMAVAKETTTVDM